MIRMHRPSRVSLLTASVAVAAVLSLSAPVLGATGDEKLGAYLAGRIAGAPGTGPFDPKAEKALQLTYTVEDPNVFTTPWSAQVTYRRSVQPWTEQVCAENIVEYWPGMNIGVPKADKPDF